MAIKNILSWNTLKNQTMKRSAALGANLEKIIITLGILLVLINTFFIFVYCKTKSNYHVPFYFEPGYQFVQFQEKLNGVKEIGYLTNKDFSREKNDGIFLQAQYFLAPTLLKLNSPAPELNILDYSSQIFVFYKIKEMKATVMVDNPYGQALIRKSNP